MSAVSKVFSLPELIEQILDHTSLKDVLPLQRVNKVFMRTIEASPRLQVKLFFKPAKYATARRLRQADLDPTPNEFLLCAMGVKYSRIFHLHDDKPGMYENNKEPGMDDIVTIIHVFDRHAKRPRERRKVLKPGSWEKMALLHPPVHANVQTKSSVVEWHGNKGCARNLHKRQEAGMLSALQASVIEMAKQSREFRGIRNGKLGSG